MFNDRHTTRRTPSQPYPLVTTFLTSTSWRRHSPVPTPPAPCPALSLCPRPQRVASRSLFFSDTAGEVHLLVFPGCERKPTSIRHYHRGSYKNDEQPLKTPPLNAIPTRMYRQSPLRSPLEIRAIGVVRRDTSLQTRMGERRIKGSNPLHLLYQKALNPLPCRRRHGPSLETLLLPPRRAR